MKKAMISFLLLFVATAMSAQTVKGDMNGDNELTVTDVTLLVDAILGNTQQQTVDPFAVDNSAVTGSWRAGTNGSVFTLNANGTTNYSGAATYKYFPYQHLLLLYDEQGNTLKTMVLSEVKTDRLSALDYTASVSVTYNAVTLVSGLTMSQTELTLNNGTTAQLTVTATPDNATVTTVTWSSSDTSVAKVSESGLVTTVAAGTCTITATATDGSGVSATCQVTVKQLVTSITLNQTKLALVPGTFQTLTATVLPSNATNKKLEWSSSDENVAVVATNGSIIGVSEGKCTVTCAADDDSGIETTCSVSVISTSDGHGFVDLGLPSGTLWATCNVGASTPEGYGDYFAWGETNTKETYYWSNYALCNGTDNSLTKYCDESDYGDNDFTDNLTELELSDDAAYANWGSNWRIPTIDQFYELINTNNTTTAWTTQNGVNGYLVTSKTNGNTLFFPAAGYRDSSLKLAGSDGNYWSRTLNVSNPRRPDYARDGYFFKGGLFGAHDDFRYYGESVRPVRISE